ncbi:RHS repeat-associated core domain-containing protein [Pseudomonas putida]|uniref:RHS repeat-associated core domain-containing protein n=1 Tax=Pseudomonas putida TaxID=303 RepID=UPI0039061249
MSRRDQIFRRFYQGQQLCTLLTQDEAWMALRANRELISEQLLPQGRAPYTILPGADSSRSVISTKNAKALTNLAYTPYGYTKERFPSSGRLRFNGQLPEASISCYLLGSYRLFSSCLMRFFTPDAWSPFGAGGLNAYAYCENDPLNHSDPSGHGKVPNKSARPSSPTQKLHKEATGKLKTYNKRKARLEAKIEAKIASQRKGINTEAIDTPPYPNLQPVVNQINSHKKLITSIQNSKLENQNDHIDLVAASMWAMAFKHDLGTTTVTGIPSKSIYANHIKKLAGDLNEAPINTIKKMTGIHDSMHYDEFSASAIRQEP